MDRFVAHREEYSADTYDEATQWALDSAREFPGTGYLVYRLVPVLRVSCETKFELVQEGIDVLHSL